MSEQETTSTEIEVVVNYSASSNISYQDQETFTFDREEWEEADDSQREDMVHEAFMSFLAEDISYDWKS